MQGGGLLCIGQVMCKPVQTLDEDTSGTEYVHRVPGSCRQTDALKRPIAAAPEEDVRLRHALLLASTLAPSACLSSMHLTGSPQLWSSMPQSVVWADH